jgi:hypothetical protein
VEGGDGGGGRKKKVSVVEKLVVTTANGPCWAVRHVDFLSCGERGVHRFSPMLHGYTRKVPCRVSDTAQIRGVNTFQEVYWIKNNYKKT